MPIVKEIVFGEGLMSPTISGDKQITLRKYRSGAHDFKKDEVVRGTFKEGLNILLRVKEDTVVKPFSELTDEEAVQDGFQDAEDAFNGLKDYYPDLKKTDQLARILFEVLHHQGEPIVSFNEFA